jgi:hypothetical protein
MLNFLLKGLLSRRALQAEKPKDYCNIESKLFNLKSQIENKSKS